MTDTTQPSPGTQPFGQGDRAGRVVVGVDGSEGSLKALRWALGEARVRGTSVHAVMGWTWHPNWEYTTVGNMYAAPSAVLPSSYEPFMNPPVPPEHGAESDTSEAVRNELDQAVEKVVAEGWHDSVKVTTAAVEGHAAEALLDSATPSDLLVVGSRGHGGFTGALLGSVTQHVVSHARCPVVVVPHGR